MSSTSYLILQNSIPPSSNFPDADCDIFSIFAQFSDGRPGHHSFPAVQHPKEDEKQNRVLTFIKELSKPKKHLFQALSSIIQNCVCHSLTSNWFPVCSMLNQMFNLKKLVEPFDQRKSSLPFPTKVQEIDPHGTICIHHLYNESFCVQLFLQLLCALVHLADPGGSPSGPVS